MISNSVPIGQFLSKLDLRKKKKDRNTNRPFLDQGEIYIESPSKDHFPRTNRI